MMRGCRDDAIFEEVAVLKAEDADGFDADVVIAGKSTTAGFGCR